MGVHPGLPAGDRFRQDVQRVHPQHPPTVIPVRDFGKTVGVLTLLNNLSQPVAGVFDCAAGGAAGYSDGDPAAGRDHRVDRCSGRVRLARHCESGTRRPVTRSAPARRRAPGR
ncbi:hypothetical protein DdX_21638 [Ditylenchus destructor]|uniref:Uncharacterized protein n=1 Tax=Ditylenchus destructor TaxID=166010 RepID=A0AAD4QVD9_9BILA|nr:hypothetical protein DdX_21638 [Ditylenchus destructor]